MKLLTYTPRHLRTRRPEWDYSPIDLRYHLWVCRSDSETWNLFGHACINIDEAEDEDYANETDWQKQTQIFFPETREGWRLAWRLARMLHTHSGSCRTGVAIIKRWEYSLRDGGWFYIETGITHRVIISDAPPIPSHL